MILWIGQIVSFSKGKVSLKKLIQDGVDWDDGPGCCLAADAG